MVKIGITMGDCAGIGPEITLKALSNESINKDNEFVIYGDRSVYDEFNQKYQILPDGLDRYEFTDLHLINGPIEFGTIKAEYGKAAGDYIKQSIEDALDGKIDAVVTAPIHKKSFQLGGYGEKYPGHTEMFADLTKTDDYSMMLAHKNLRVMHVTTHVSLRQAIDLVKKERVYKTIKLGYETCKRLKLQNIRIGVCGLNPHAGDFGLFGDEDISEIEPAVKQAQADFDCVIDGPVPSDTIFSKALGGMYDMVIVMYHDQGHIPTKTVGFIYDHAKAGWSDVSGVNITLGLPVIRASVDHGTAFGKAGKGTACAESMLDAIHYAILLANSSTIEAEVS